MGLAEIQIDLAQRLDGDSYFSDITVLHERLGDLEHLIEKALGTLTKKAGKIGSFVVVASVEAFVESGDAALRFDDCRFNIFVFENVTFNNSTNGTKKAAINTAVRVCQLLHHYRPDGLAQTVYCDKSAIAPDKPPVAGVIVYRCPVRVPANLDTAAKVAEPVISPASGSVPQTVTITCATAGAAIYYTTDESYPSAANSTHATLYTVPFSVAAAAVVRAVAFKSNLIASDSALAIFT